MVTVHIIVIIVIIIAIVVVVAAAVVVIKPAVLTVNIGETSIIKEPVHQPIYFLSDIKLWRHAYANASMKLGLARVLEYSQVLELKNYSSFFATRVLDNFYFRIINLYICQSRRLLLIYSSFKIKFLLLTTCWLSKSATYCTKTVTSICNVAKETTVAILLR